MASVLISDHNVAVHRLTLEKIRKVASKVVGSTAVESMEYRVGEYPGIDGWVHEISVQLLATKLVDDKYTCYFYYKTPSSWFQMFKKARYPEWLLNRFPVKYTSHKNKRRVVFTRYETYPMANVAVPRDQKTVELLGIERPINDIVEVF